VYSLENNVQEIILDKKVLLQAGDQIGQQLSIGTTKLWKISPLENGVLVGTPRGIWLIKWQ
jgi:hypothetical protein